MIWSHIWHLFKADHETNPLRTAIRDFTGRPSTLRKNPPCRPGTGKLVDIFGYVPLDQIVFALRTSGFPDEIWTLPAEGGEPRPMLRDEFNNGSAAWTPDGTRLVFSSYRSGAQNVWELTLASGELRQITVGPGQERAAFVVPGKGLFYMHFSHTLDLIKVDLGGGSHEALTAVSDVAQMYPRFSSDGRFLVYDSNRGGLKRYPCCSLKMRRSGSFLGFT